LLENGFHKAELRAVAHVQNALLYEIPSEIDKAVKTKHAEMAKNYQKFLGENFLPYMDAIKKKNAEYVELFRTHLAKQGEELPEE
jgi:hypothetical protein